MAVIPIRLLPDPVLRQKAKRVKSFDSSIHKLVADMLETMEAASGVGLAAPQVGISLRLVVIGLPEQEPIVLVNPEIVRRKGERLICEGCLSIPGYMGDITRSVSVTVKGYDLSGKEIRIKGEELLAQALEHEIDHLNGVLYIDHMEDIEKLRKVEPEEAKVKSTTAA
ncbi:MAG: peptide deformylase [Chloroflexi bacterium]|nr:peptide deformylase [Chloroflexota bacterium]